MKKKEESGSANHDTTQTRGLTVMPLAWLARMAAFHSRQANKSTTVHRREAISGLIPHVRWGGGKPANMGGRQKKRGEKTL